jgi:hypothetical protein
VNARAAALSAAYVVSLGPDAAPTVTPEVRRAAFDAYAAGFALGQELAARAAAVRMKQLGLDLVRDAHLGAVSPLLGNRSGPGSVASLGGER